VAARCFSAMLSVFSQLKIPKAQAIAIYYTSYYHQSKEIIRFLSVFFVKIGVFLVYLNQLQPFSDLRQGLHFLLNFFSQLSAQNATTQQACSLKKVHF